MIEIIIREEGRNIFSYSHKGINNALAAYNSPGMPLDVLRVELQSIWNHIEEQQKKVLAENQFLSVKDLLTEVLKDIQEKMNGRLVELPNKALSEVADDSDGHRTRKGYMAYESAVIIEAGGRRWAIALGIAHGDYPAYSYSCCITAVPVSTELENEDQLIEQVYTELRDRWYFWSALIYAMKHGQLNVRKGGMFADPVLRLLNDRVPDFIAQNVEVQPGLIMPDGGPVVTADLKYKPEFVPFLSQIFQTVLTSFSE